MSDKYILCELSMFTLNNVRVYICEKDTVSLINCMGNDDIASELLKYGAAYETSKFQLCGNCKYAEAIADEMRELNALEYNNQNIEIEVN